VRGHANGSHKRAKVTPATSDVIRQIENLLATTADPEDLAKWKKRALDAERRLATLRRALKVD
jgi:hypothetical protein